MTGRGNPSSDRQVSDLTPPSMSTPRPSEADVEHDEWCICSTEFRAEHGDAHTRICSQQWGDLTRLLAARDAEHEREVAALREVAEQIAYEHAATVDGEWGCCHDEDALRSGGRVPEFDWDEFEPIPTDCLGKKTLDRHLRALLPRDDAAGAGGAG